jgi:hypothetical protein
MTKKEITPKVSGDLNKMAKSNGPVPASQNPDVDGSASNETEPPLTPEEQMALYEKDLKENDWGHQPC